MKGLFKKQFLESLSGLYLNRKNGEMRSKSGILAYALLYLFLFVILANWLFVVADSLCSPLVELGFGWMYFAMMGLVAVVMGVFGSIFNTYTSLYQAKDNDLLLSFPIPIERILLMRLSSVYMMGLLYESIVMVPTLIVWFRDGKATTIGMVFSILILLVLSFFILTVSCVLGWIVAVISSRIRNKSIISVIASVTFIGLFYYFIYFKAYSILMEILVNAQVLAERMQSILYPVYQMGRAAEGSVVGMLVFSGIVLGIFLIVFGVMKQSFLKLATTNRGTVKVKYKERPVKAGSVEGALLRKEFRRFTGCATYMLNCGLGTLILILGGIGILLKADSVRMITTILSGMMGDGILLLAAAMICTMVTMNDITAPSVSLEGKHIWLVQSLPVSGWKVLKAKLQLHLILTVVPVVFLLGCVEMVFQFAWIEFIILSIVVLLFVWFMAELGLVSNLKLPNLTWTSEISPVKQGASVTIALFGGWLIVAGFGGVYYLLHTFISSVVYLLLVAVVLLIGVLGQRNWLRSRGADIFEKL